MNAPPNAGQFEALLEEVKRRLASFWGGCMLIGISGFGGAGKSTLAEQLRSALDGAEVVSIDSFITHELEERSSDWSCFDRTRFLRQLVAPISEGKPAEFDLYDWNERCLIGTRKLEPPQILFLEGCSIFHPDLIPYYAFTVWVEVSLDIATERGMKRDRGRGEDNDSLWLNVWAPNEVDFSARYSPESRAEFVYKN